MMVAFFKKKRKRWLWLIEENRWWTVVKGKNQRVVEWLLNIGKWTTAIFDWRSGYSVKG